MEDNAEDDGDSASEELSDDEMVPPGDQGTVRIVTHPPRRVHLGHVTRIPKRIRLPKTVTRLDTPEGSAVFLVGTAHFSKESHDDVATVRIGDRRISSQFVLPPINKNAQFYLHTSLKCLS